MEALKIYPQTMDEHSFTALIISGHRITIREDVFEDLELRKGDRVRITVRKVQKRMREHAIVTE